LPESPERQEAWRLANDRLGITVQLRAGVSATTASGVAVSPRLLAAAERLERSALAGVRAHPALARILAELGPEHFSVERHQRAAPVLAAGADDEELTPFFAELDAVAADEAIDEQTAEQLLLRLRERRLQEQVAGAEDDRLVDLQQALARVRERIREFA
jgi:hypothetical protein